MIYEVNTNEDYKNCDTLLNKLILDEATYYDKILNKKYKVNNYYKNNINPNDILLVYKENKKIIGYIYAKFIQNNINLYKGYLIDALYVEKDYRNNHIATKLIDELFNRILIKDIKFIDINVMANNIAAITLYKKYKFDNFKYTFRKYI